MAGKSGSPQTMSYTPPKLVTVKDPQALLEKLADHIRDVHSAIDADSETGSHLRNNVAAAEWAKANPFLLKWIKELLEMLPEEN